MPEGPWQKYDVGSGQGPWAKYGQQEPNLPPAVASGEAARNIASPQGGAPPEKEGFWSGLVQGAKELGTGTIEMAKPPHGAAEWAAATIGAPLGGVAGYRTIESAIEKGKSALQAFSQGEPAKGLLGTIGAVDPLAPDVTKLYEQSERGDVGGAIGRGTAYGVAAAAPEIIKGGQYLARKAAVPLAESALGVTNKGRAFGRTPGEAALAETKGFSPEKVLASTRESMRGIGTQLEDTYNQAGAAGKTVSIQPALDVLEREKTAALTARRTELAANLQANIDRLSTDPATGQPTTTMQPSELWKIKTGQGDLTNWNPNMDPKIAHRINRAVYRAIDDELDRAAPEVKDLNQRYSSLKVVQNRADIESRNAGLIQSSMGRFARHTGALAGALAGGFEGGRYGGPLGAIAGGVTGLVVPELIASPTTQMAAARGLWAIGGGERVPPYVRPAVQPQVQPQAQPQPPAPQPAQGVNLPGIPPPQPSLPANISFGAPGRAPLGRIGQVAPQSITPEAPVAQTEMFPGMAEERATLGRVGEAAQAESPLGRIPFEKPAGIVEMPLSDLKVDPARFQFKRDVGQGGASGKLKTATEFDPHAAGVLSVWRDPASGETFVVNGHHRFELAQRLGESKLPVRYIEAENANQAMLKGAIQNIREGQGTAIDTAKIFRMMDNPEEFARNKLGLTDTKIDEAIALSNLTDSIWRKVYKGELKESIGKAIGENVETPEGQEAALKMIEDRADELTEDDIRNTLRFAKSAPTQTTTEQTLFGPQEMTRNLAIEKGKLATYIQKKLGSEKSIFSAVSRGSEAIKERGVGEVSQEEARNVARNAMQNRELFDRLMDKSGPVGEAMNRAAERLGHGEPAAKVKQDLYKEIVYEIGQTLSRGTAQDTGMVR